MAVDRVGRLLGGILLDGLAYVLSDLVLVLEALQVRLDALDVLDLALPHYDLADGQGVFVHQVQAVVEVGAPSFGDLDELLEQGVLRDVVRLRQYDVVPVGEELEGVFQEILRPAFVVLVYAEQIHHEGVLGVVGDLGWDQVLLIDILNQAVERALSVRADSSGGLLRPLVFLLFKLDGDLLGVRRALGQPELVHHQIVLLHDL